MARNRLAISVSGITKEEVLGQLIMNLTAKNTAPSTIRCYTQAWQYFNLFYKGEVQDITSQTILAWVLYLKHQGVKDVSINTYLAHLRGILNFCASQDWILPIKVKLLRQQEIIKEVYTDEELKRLLVKPDKRKCTFSEFRNWVIINTLISTGIRRSTIINLMVADIDFTSGMMNLSHTKNKKATIVPISSSLLAIQREYLLLSKLPANSYLFPDAFGSPLKADRLSHIVAIYNRHHGVSKTSVHAYRHTYAKLMIMNGCDVFKLQKLLGHSSLEMTRRYVELYSIDLKQGYDDINPLDRITRNRKRIVL